MINQLTVFIENRPDRLKSLCRTLGDASISMQALMVADTTEFGIVRIVCDAPSRARSVLREAGYSSSLTPVIAVKVPNVPGGLADALELLSASDVNVEYAYCFFHAAADKAINVLKVSEGQEAQAESIFTAAGFDLLTPSDVYQNESE